MGFETFDYWMNDPIIKEITKSQAAFVRNLRICDGKTWQTVASICNIEWDGGWENDPMAGKAICAMSAPYFKEKHNVYPWN